MFYVDVGFYFGCELVVVYFGGCELLDWVFIEGDIDGGVYGDIDGVV